MNSTNQEVDIYERLADALEALPHGFARTESGVEIKLIKMAFTPEEVSLAGHLTRFFETPSRNHRADRRRRGTEPNCHGGALHRDGS